MAKLLAKSKMTGYTDNKLANDVAMILCGPLSCFCRCGFDDGVIWLSVVIS